MKIYSDITKGKVLNIFINIYKKKYNNQSITDNNIINTILGVDSNGLSIITGIINRLESYSYNDISNYISSNCSLPIGLKIDFINNLKNEYNSIFDNNNNNKRLLYILETDKSCSGRSITELNRLWLLWKNNEINLEQLFSLLNNYIILGYIETTLAEQFIVIILKENGHINSDDRLHATTLRFNDILDIDYLTIINDSSLDYGRDCCRDSRAIITPIRVFTRKGLIVDTSFTSDKGSAKLENMSESSSDNTSSKSNGISIECRYSYSTALPMQSNSYYLWEKLESNEAAILDHLILYVPPMKSQQNNSDTKLLRKPTLLIGDVIKTHQGTMEVHQICNVDAYSAPADKDFVQFSILLEGVIHSGGEFFTCRSNDESISECETEVGDNIAEGNCNDNNSNVDSGEEDMQYSIPPMELRRQFFVVYANHLHGSVVMVQAICPLCPCSDDNELSDDNGNAILLDQIPIGIHCLSHNLVAVFGTNGLLALVRNKNGTNNSTTDISTVKEGIESGITSADTSFSSTVLAPCMQSNQTDSSASTRKNNLANCPQSQGTVDFYCQEFITFTDSAVTSGDDDESGEILLSRFRSSVCLLCADDVFPESSSTITSHSGSSCVTHVAYANAVQLLVSSDNQGKICVWKIDKSKGRGSLLCDSFALHSEYPPSTYRSKNHSISAISPSCHVQNIFIADSGMHIAVALTDRLLLLGVAAGLSNEKTVNSAVGTYGNQENNTLVIDDRDSAAVADGEQQDLTCVEGDSYAANHSAETSTTLYGGLGMLWMRRYCNSNHVTKDNKAANSESSSMSPNARHEEMSIDDLGCSDPISTKVIREVQFPLADDSNSGTALPHKSPLHKDTKSRLPLVEAGRNESYNIYLRSYLDVVEGTRVRYFVAFGKESIRVWRLSNSEKLSYGPTEISVSSVHADIVEAVNGEKKEDNLDSEESSRSYMQSPLRRTPSIMRSSGSVDASYHGSLTGEEGSAGLSNDKCLPVTVPCVSITSWLHQNVDNFDTRQGRDLMFRQSSKQNHECKHSTDTSMQLPRHSDLRERGLHNCEGDSAPSIGKSSRPLLRVRRMGDVSSYVSDGVLMTSMSADDFENYNCGDNSDECSDGNEQDEFDDRALHPSDTDRVHSSNIDHNHMLLNRGYVVDETIGGLNFWRSRRSIQKNARFVKVNDELIPEIIPFDVGTGGDGSIAKELSSISNDNLLTDAAGAQLSTQFSSNCDDSATVHTSHGRNDDFLSFLYSRPTQRSVRGVSSSPVTTFLSSDGTPDLSSRDFSRARSLSRGGRNISDLGANEDTTGLIADGYPDSIDTNAAIRRELAYDAHDHAFDHISVASSPNSPESIAALLRNSPLLNSPNSPSRGFEPTSGGSHTPSSVTGQESSPLLRSSRSNSALNLSSLRRMAHRNLMLQQQRQFPENTRFIDYGMMRVNSASSPLLNNLYLNSSETFSPFEVPEALNADTADDYRRANSSQIYTSTPDSSIHGSNVFDRSFNSLLQRHHFSLRRFHSNASTKILRLMLQIFRSDASSKFRRVRKILVLLCTFFQPPTLSAISAALDSNISNADVLSVISTDLVDIVDMKEGENHNINNRIVCFKSSLKSLPVWLCGAGSSFDCYYTHKGNVSGKKSIFRVGKEFWIDPAEGHNLLCALYLKYCGNKSVAVEHSWQDYLRAYGPSHLSRSSRGLRLLTTNIRKIDETANIRAALPPQIGYISGLYEIYARRVGLRGRIPREIGELQHLRVLSMGNNHLSGALPSSLGNLRNLQRVVLHQNNLRGAVPGILGRLGCIVNLAGNPLLLHGEDVPQHEKTALEELYCATTGDNWLYKANWCSQRPVARWYKVGVLSSHVHSLVMSSNGMEGHLPESLANLNYLRMIELATMPGLTGDIPQSICSIATLRRLCICRCNLTGPLPSEIGDLVGLEELQLFGNNLTGRIPQSLGKLINLRLLSLGEYTGGNNFTPAPLPRCLASLVKLEALFMANCNICGELPAWIGTLTELRQLDLQRNQISGVLPPCIGSLQQLLYLNVKDNTNLGGRLPLSALLSLGKLNRLSLVHCSFEDADDALEVMKAHLPRCKVWF